VTVGLRCARIGTSSVRYEIGVFRNDEHRASAEGHFVHVYVRRDAQDRTTPMPGRLREALQALLVAPAV
jgi:acyl-CoA thioester hydrolase